MGGLKKLKKLPLKTLVYPGHEYTDNFLAFALWLEPGNANVASKADWMLVRRFGLGSKYTTVPSTIGSEMLSNPFMRCDETSLAHRVGCCAGSWPPEVLRCVHGLYGSTSRFWSLTMADC